MKTTICFLFFVLSSFILTAQIIYEDFESGTSEVCQCPAGYTCANDAGRVVDGIHPIYTNGSTGCSTLSVLPSSSNHTSSLGAYSGIGYVYFYAGKDKITTPDLLFLGGEQIELCIWYSGPPFAGFTLQDGSSAHFSFAMDSIQVSPIIPVPTGTVWTQYCYTVTVTPGNHNFSILSGLTDVYAMWFDDLSIVDLSCIDTLDLGNDTILCQGNTIQLNATIPNATYQWNDNSVNATFTVSQHGAYWVKATNNCGVQTDTINVDYDSIPTINLGSDTTLCQGETLALYATTSNANYIWQDNSTTSPLIALQQGTYWIKETNNCGTKADSIYIEVENCNCALNIPNVFTPNRDEINDLFKIKTNNITNLNCKIYNRWGILISELTKINESWDGRTTSGLQCDTGVYYYTLLALCNDGKEFNETGYIHLIN